MATWLVTGANRGIGLEMVRAILSRDDHVIAACRKPSPALQALAQDGLTILPLDVADAASILAAAESLKNRTIDRLINNAGIIGPVQQSTLAMDFDGFAETLATNTLGPLRVTQALLPMLRRSTDGKIAVISSQMSQMTSAKSDRIAYRASKSATNKVFQALATDLVAEKIAVLIISPGWVRTDMGGGGAPLSAQDSAEGIICQVERLTLAQSGTFCDYSGAPMAW